MFSPSVCRDPPHSPIDCTASQAGSRVSRASLFLRQIIFLILQCSAAVVASILFRSWVPRRGSDLPATVGMWFHACASMRPSVPPQLFPNGGITPNKLPPFLLSFHFLNWSPVGIFQLGMETSALHCDA